ncbi:PREDICTED: uncharacterized protein LOC108356677 [Rhagoletis zephyria]|uniref:uncharacterized protein LOC108356677 n=1 Tax=Rhagoletis zephyria TaxID=28612 RepID=UPI000811618D|nr:PREDICTED: uncharacterized protein LOC108356677 [Rhagoletis zephyria]
MSARRAIYLQRGLAAICIWSSLTLLLTAAAPMPKNFFDQGNQVAEFFQNGAALRERPGMSIDGNEQFRRKRSLDGSELTAETGPRTSFTQLMRNLNAPCHGGGAGGTGGGTDTADGGDDIVDEARRRIARMKARKAAAGKKAKNSKSKSKSKSSQRRRRQTEADDLEGLGESKERELKEQFMVHLQQFSENMNRMYEHIASSVMNSMKRMEENFGSKSGQS